MRASRRHLIVDRRSPPLYGILVSPAHVKLPPTPLSAEVVLPRPGDHGREVGFSSIGPPTVGCRVTPDRSQNSRAGHLDGKRPKRGRGLVGRLILPDIAVQTEPYPSQMTAGARRRNSPADLLERGERVLLLLRLPTSLLSIAFTGQGLFDPEFLAWLQIEGVPFDLSDDVLLQNLPLEAAEGVLHSLAVLERYLSQMAPRSSPDFWVGIIWFLPGSEGSLPWAEQPRAAPAFLSVPCRA